MHPQGEVGILREVLNISPADRCFLHITYEASQYVGCLLIEDPTSCYQIAKFLHSCCNRSIAEIGSLDLHPLPLYSPGRPVWSYLNWQRRLFMKDTQPYGVVFLK